MNKYYTKLIILWVVFVVGILILMNSTGLGTVAVNNLARHPQGVNYYPIYLEQYIAFASVNKMYPADLLYKPPEQSKEELYQDIFISLLLPYIQKEVDKYYSKYLISTPMVAPYTVYVLSAERPNGYRSFLFNLKLRVESYIGPHIGVGTDYITVTVGGTGDIKIERFERIKSYELPPNYQGIIKKGYKNSIP